MCCPTGRSDQKKNKQQQQNKQTKEQEEEEDDDYALKCPVNFISNLETFMGKNERHRIHLQYIVKCDTVRLSLIVTFVVFGFEPRYRHHTRVNVY